MENGDVTWGDFIKFLELFFNIETWRGIYWCDMLLKFSEIFFNEDDMVWDDVAYLHVKKLKLITCSRSYKYKYIGYHLLL
jgi:hypothetical protein